MKHKQSGFTIIELLIATAVFSVVLLALAIAIMRIGQVYYKGITTSRTQEAARSIIDDVSRAVQFSGGGFTPADAAKQRYCVGERRYSFRLNEQYIEGTSPHVMLVDQVAACPDAAMIDFTNPGSSARELMGDRMRLGKFSITENARLYTITVQVVYGDNDLIEYADGASSYNPAVGYRCKTGFSGSAFCAVSELTTTVQKRVQ